MDVIGSGKMARKQLGKNASLGKNDKHGKPSQTMCYSSKDTQGQQKYSMAKD